MWPAHWVCAPFQRSGAPKHRGPNKTLKESNGNGVWVEGPSIKCVIVKHIDIKSCILGNLAIEGNGTCAKQDAGPLKHSNREESGHISPATSGGTAAKQFKNWKVTQ